MHASPVLLLAGQPAATLQQVLMPQYRGIQLHLTRSCVYAGHACMYGKMKLVKFSIIAVRV